MPDVKFGRRESDPLVLLLAGKIEAIEKQLTENTDITRQVYDVLATFRVIAKVAKWLTAIVLLLTSIWGLVKVGADVVPVRPPLPPM